jgi:hypothetical protein
LITFFGTNYVKYKTMILLYVLGPRLQKKNTMSLPVSDQHVPVGRKNVLAPGSATEFPQTVVDSCAIPPKVSVRVVPSIHPSHPVQR